MDRRLFLGAAGSVLGGCALEMEPGEDLGSVQQVTTTWPDGTYATFLSSGRLYATRDYESISYTTVVAAAAGTSWHTNNPKRFSVIVTAMNEVRGGLCGNAARARYNAINNWCSEFARWVLLAAGLNDVGVCVVAGRPNCQQMLYFSSVRTVQDAVGFFAVFGRYTSASQMTKTSVRPGDYLALTNSAGVKKGHSAIAMAVSADYKWVWTAEGNVGDCVRWNLRPFFNNGVLHSDIDGVGNIDLLL
jgi:hypothetical protein